MLHYAMCHDNPDLYDPEQHQLQVLPKVQNLVKRQQHCTGKSFSEALSLASVNPQYDKRLFIEFPQKIRV